MAVDRLCGTDNLLPDSIPRMPLSRCLQRFPTSVARFILGNLAVIHFYVVSLVALFAIVSPTRAQQPSDEFPINDKFWIKPGLPSADPKIFLPLPKCTWDPAI